MVSHPASINASVWVKHRENVQLVFHDPFFANITQVEPPTIRMREDGESGYCTPFDPRPAFTALRHTGKYMASMNIAWLDMLYTPLGGVPISWPCVEGLRKHYFSDVDTCHGLADIPIEVPVLASQMDARDVGAKGTWKHTSPTEILMALLSAIASAVTTGADHAVLAKWRYHMTTAPCLFVLVPTTDSIVWRAQQLREDVSQKTSLARTPVQRIFDVVNRREAQGMRISAEAMVKLYSENLRLSERAEPITKSWVESAFTIWDRALCKPTIQAVVLMEEAHHDKSLFNATHKMQAIISKARTPHDIEWCFLMLHDMHVAGHITSSDTSLRALQGQLKSDMGKGLLDLLLTKRRLLMHMLDETIAKAALRDWEKTSIREVLSGPQQYRKFNGYSKDQGRAFLSCVRHGAGCHSWRTAFVCSWRNAIRDMVLADTADTLDIAIAHASLARSPGGTTWTSSGEPVGSTARTSSSSSWRSP